jgi:nucleoside phosphorylase
VVVVQLLDMGNVEAAVAATRIIQRWLPQNILMVGIAGGVRTKVALGDVVVSQYCYYYEFAKLKPEGDEIRPRQIDSDSLLYGRASHHEEDEWKARVGVSRPDKGDSRPTIHCGPIACGRQSCRRR